MWKNYEKDLRNNPGPYPFLPGSNMYWFPVYLNGPVLWGWKPVNKKLQNKSGWGGEGEEAVNFIILSLSKDLSRFIKNLQNAADISHKVDTSPFYL